MARKRNRKLDVHVRPQIAGEFGWLLKTSLKVLWYGSNLLLAIGIFLYVWYSTSG